MTVTNLEDKSVLYDVFDTLGVKFTEDKFITDARKEIGKWIDKDDTVLENQFNRILHARITYDDIDGIGYLYPHIRLHKVDPKCLEIWINGEAVNPSTITWMDDYCGICICGIFNRFYEETDEIIVYYNELIFDRYSVVAESEGTYSHTQTYRMDSMEFAGCDHPEGVCYCIADGKMVIPTVSKADGNISFTCKYTKSLDMIFASNLVGCFEVEADTTFRIDDLYSNKCYTNFMLNLDIDFDIQTKFYPYMRVSESGFFRVYDNSKLYVPHPEVSRILTYPEFMFVDDPYDTDNEYLNNLQYVDTEILAGDSDETIIEKFKSLAPWFFRIWQHFPKFPSEVADFLVCDNEDFAFNTFVKGPVIFSDGTEREMIYSTVPFESWRDIIFYKGYVFSDYSVVRLIKLDTGSVVENGRGFERYVIDPKYDMRKFTIIKFNSNEDTMIINAGNYVDKDNIVKLHMKLNRFYRNLLVLRGRIFDLAESENKVRVSTEPPETKDDHIWFELLVNADPDEFAQDTDLVIRSFGLEIDNVPDDIKVGTYNLGLPLDDGPEEYTQLLETFFSLGRYSNDTDKLLLQHVEEAPDSVEVNNIKVGPLPEEAELNDLVLETESGEDLGELNSFWSADKPEDVPDPEEGDFLADPISALLSASNDLSYIMPDGNMITANDIGARDREYKLELIEDKIEDPGIKAEVNDKLNAMDDEKLDDAVFMILEAEHYYNTSKNSNETTQALLRIADELGITIEDPDNFWANLSDEETAAIAKEAKKINIRFVTGKYSPDEPEENMLWIDIPAIMLEEYIHDILSDVIYEGYYKLPDGYYIVGGNDEGRDRAPFMFDYGAHGGEDENELFRPVIDDSLHTVHYGKDRPEEFEDGDIWIEFLNEVQPRVCYSSTNDLVLRVDERLLLVEFSDEDDITVFVFDDIVLNFRGRLGIKYLSILADLINSEVISKDNVLYFYQRLITPKDYFDAGLTRLYTGKSHVVSTAKLDTTDYAIVYSSNIERLHIDYTSDTLSNKMRQRAWEHLIDYRDCEEAFLDERMLLFVNGQYIHRVEYQEVGGMLQLLNFDEEISCVDILYSKRDAAIARCKKIALQYWQEEYTIPFGPVTAIGAPQMEYMHVCDKTYRGYYDVLLSEYILNDRLKNMLNYFEENPEQFQEYRNDLVHKFRDISDDALLGETDPDKARIIIPSHHSNKSYYQIGV